MEPELDTMDLGPIFEPAPIEFQFDTLGWYVLGAILLVVVVTMVFKGIRHYLKNAYRREAQRMVQTIIKQFNNQKDPACLNDALVVLKGVAITTYSRSQVADLHGEQWMAFLDAKGKHITFKKYSHTIKTALYKNEIANESEAIGVLRMALKWVKVHA